MALELAEDRRRRVARELGSAAGLEAVDRLDQPEAGDLHEVVERLVGVAVAEREVAGERDVALDQLVAGSDVTVAVVAHEQLALGVTSLLTLALVAREQRRADRDYGLVRTSVATAITCLSSFDYDVRSVWQPLLAVGASPRGTEVNLRARVSRGNCLSKDIISSLGDG